MSYLSTVPSVAVSLVQPDTGDVETAYVEYRRKKNAFVCDAHETIWCDHIEKMLANHLDSEALYALVATSSGNDLLVELPILPSVGFFQLVTMSPFRLGTKERWNAAEIKFDTEASGYAKDHELCLLTEGDSMMSLRLTYIDWFQSNMMQTMMQTKVICHSPSHKMFAEAQWQKDMKAGGTSRLSQYLCLWATGKCMMCHRTISVENGWEDDLIPDDRSASRWR